jgi:hypothetical protein
VLNIAIIAVPAAAGLVLFALLRQRQTQLFMAGVAAVAAALLVMAGIFGAIIVSGNY